MKVTQLKVGDRVLLFCPTAKHGTRCAATFEGISPTGRAVFSETRAAGMIAIVQMTSFEITADGNMKDAHAKDIYIERRLHSDN